ncbi:hypothetical protein LTR64_005949 [Lithohypha guttulata]|uniref:uncharacterized protein n=1 Tax=Lithohypha guttulata TaxID=1690604 RepID=UPI00315CAE4B
MQTLETISSTEPPQFRLLHSLLPASIVVNTFANFFTLLISVGAYGPARRFWHSFEIFVSLAWLSFLVALTLSCVAQAILSYQRHHIVDAFDRGPDGYRKWRDGGTGSKSIAEKVAVAFVVKVPIALLVMLATLIGLMFCSLCVVAHCLAVGWIGFMWTLSMVVLAVAADVLSGHA